MQALKNSVAPGPLYVCFWHKPSRKRSLVILKIVGYTPQSQVRMFVASTAMPVPAATPASAFL
jgi:hypothetical protein